MASKTQLTLIFLVLAFAIIHAKPQNNRKHTPHNYGEVDNVPSASGHHGHHHGRVQIKVYRGQSKGHGWETFAPYGYWVRQPPDNHGWSHGHH